MAENISRLLRDGALDGEHAPALSISDSIHSPFGSQAFNHLVSYLSDCISKTKSQARSLVIVAFDQSPFFYLDMLKSKGIDDAASEKWIRIVDCYSDPLGWKKKIVGFGVHANSLQTRVTPYKDVKDMKKLFTSIIDLGRGMSGESKVCFSVAIDSVSTMLRHATLSSVSSLINNLRSHEQVSSMLWLMHRDLHELRVPAALEYLSSMVASLDPLTDTTDGQRINSVDALGLEQNSRGRFSVRIKRRNGRVRVIDEEFYMDQSGIKFVAVSSINLVINQSLLPKVQFSLNLSEKERVDKAKVVLPFEHQGNGGTIEIYDGRRSLSETHNSHLTKPVFASGELNTETHSGKGEIHYFRDSDDEAPDSDEDPDDDLDI